MDTFPSSPPAAVRADLTALRPALDDSGILPKSLDGNVARVVVWPAPCSCRHQRVLPTVLPTRIQHQPARRHTR